MIQASIRFIRDQLNEYLKDVDPHKPGNQEVKLENIAMVDAYNDNSTRSVTDSIVISVANIEEEKNLRNVPHIPVASSNGNGNDTISLLPPPVYLNVYLLFSANMNNYENSLLQLSRIVRFFQRQHVFLEPTTTEGVDKLILDIVSMNFEQLSQLWSIMGSKYVPSIMYKMRIVPVRDAPATDASIVRRIRQDETSF